MINKLLNDVNTSVNEEQALYALDCFEKEWGSHFPTVVKERRKLLEKSYSYVFLHASITTIGLCE